MQKQKKLSPLDRRCLMKFYLHELKLLQENSSDYVKSLGIEAGYETVLDLAEEEPLFIKIVSHDDDNFIVLLDENCVGDYSPIFIMKNGVEEFFDDSEDDDDDDEVKY